MMRLQQFARGLLKELAIKRESLGAELAALAHWPRCETPTELGSYRFVADQSFGDEEVKSQGGKESDTS